MTILKENLEIFKILSKKMYKKNLDEIEKFKKNFQVKKKLENFGLVSEDNVSIIGNNNILFINNSNNEVNHLTNENYKHFAHNIKFIDAELKKTGIQMFLLIIPEKDEIFSDSINKNYFNFFDYNINKEIYLNFNNNIEFFKKKINFLYFFNSHFNTFFYGMIFFKFLIKNKLVLPKIYRDDFKDFLSTDDLSIKFFANNMPLTRTIYKNNFDIIDYKKSENNINHYKHLIMGSKNPHSLANVLVFGDSHFHDEGSLSSYFGNYFKKVEFNWSFNIDLSLIKKQRPDYVIIEVAKRFINNSRLTIK